MTVTQVSRFFAVLALAAQAAVVVWLGLSVASRSSAAAAAVRARVVSGVAGSGLWMAAGIAAIATFGSLYYSEVARFVPCELCWFQRIAMYPLVVLLAIAAWRGDRSIRLPALVLAGGGLMVSTYHYLIQLYPRLEGTSCSPSVPCASAYIDIFGFVSIPYMAWSAFALLIVVLWAGSSSATGVTSAGRRPGLGPRRRMQ